MSFKRIVLFAGVFLFVYLGLYAWNSRTGTIDRLAEHTGLEFVGLVLKPGLWAERGISDFWTHYIYLQDVRAENDRLAEQVRSMTLALSQAAEDQAELKRLRSLMLLTPPEGWIMRGSRVLAGRIGPLASFDSLLIGNGYFSGAGPGTPVATENGVIGRVLRAAPYTATILLLTDPNSSIAVISEKSRAAGILTGNGANAPLDLKYVTREAPLELGELLITSGRDNVFPKGLPVAVVTSIQDDVLVPFRRVQAESLVDTASLEEVALLERRIEHFGMPVRRGTGQGPMLPHEAGNAP